MKINRNNYEIYFLDYMEGNLSKEKIAELEVFISENPDLKQEFEGFENIKLSPENKGFSLKSSLKKSALATTEINEQNFNEWCIADVEDDLDEAGRKKLEHYINEHPASEKELETYRNLHLSANKNILFAEKPGLYKVLEEEEISKHFNEYCLACLEGLLSAGSVEKFNHYLDNNPEQKNAFESYAKLRLKADKNLVFHDKVSLKRTKVIPFGVRRVFTIASAAAAIVILFFVIRNSNVLFFNPVEEIAQSGHDEQYVEKVETAENMLAENTEAKEKESKKPKTTLNKKEEKMVPEKRDTTQTKSNRIRNLSPINIRFAQQLPSGNVLGAPEISSPYLAVNQVSDQPVELPVEGEKEIPEKDYYTLNEYVVSRFRKAVLGEDYKTNRPITYLDLAKAGLEGIDKITPGDIDFEHKQNKDGELEYLAVNTKLIGFEKKFNQ